MTNEKKENAQSKPTDGQRVDSTDALEQELERERSEGTDAIGDAATDRNLSGSSTWTTLPPDKAPKSDS
ncbi:MAG: hypothetical protein ABI408_06275 [Gemmatimonadaceae bacterium]